MLGVSNSLLFSRAPVRSLIFEYNSDFTSSIDGYEQTSVTDGTINFTSNDSGPDGAGGWLKAVFDTTQTGQSGINKNLGWASKNGTAEMGSTKKGDEFELSGKIYLQETGSDHWDGTGTVRTGVIFGTPNHQDQFEQSGLSVLNVEQNTNTSFNWSATSSVGIPNFSYIDNLIFPNWLSLSGGGSRFPQAGATFYIKDINLKIYRISPKF